MPMVWNDQADAKLLPAIITMTTTKLNHAAIAEFMGPECTASAVQHRIQRVKEKAKNDPALGNNATEGGTPEKKKEQGSAKKPKRTPKRNRKTKAGEECVKMEENFKVEDDFKVEENVLNENGLDDPFA